MKQLKRVLAFFMAFVLLVSVAPVDVSAAGSSTVIEVESENVARGEDVSVDIVIRNNPGILGATLEISFAEELTLLSATAGEAFSYLAMTKPGKLESPCRFTWDGLDFTEEDVKDGTILTLTFSVADDAEAGVPLEIIVSAPEGDIYDNELNYVDVTTVAGAVTVSEYKPGDVNNDGRVNVQDIILIRRYLVGGYDVEINKRAANVNGDSKITSADVILIRRYLAGGYGVEPLPSPDICDHTMEATAAKAPTCEEVGNYAYWYCTTCKKYYTDAYGNQETRLEDTVRDAIGHNRNGKIEAVEPKPGVPGWTEGTYCTNCEKVMDEPQPWLLDEYTITYEISESDEYLKSLEIVNKNPTTFTERDTIKLTTVSANGYKFLGWYDKATGERISTIPAGTKENFELVAHWEKEIYTIIFDSPDIPWSSVTYTVDEGETLTNPKWFGYTFVGWSNDEGFLVTRIKPGTTGNMTLHANWTSNRNKATSYSRYGDPIIVEDDSKGQFLFIYDIGVIDNVPLYGMEDKDNFLGNSDGINIDQEYTFTDTITEDQAKTIAKAIANTTTRSSGWVLAEEWEQIYEEGTEDQNSKIKSEERTNTEGNVVGGKYFVSNSEGGSSYVSTESGGSYAASSKVTTDTSKGINTSYDTSTEMYADAKLGVKNETEVGAEVSAPVGVAKVSASVKNTTTVESEVTSGRKDNESFHVDTSSSSYVGTVDTNDTSAYYNVAANQSSTWNSTQGFESSYETSRTAAVSNAISEQVTKTTSYNLTEALKGSSKETVDITGTEDIKDEYSTSLKYSKGTSETITKRVKQQAKETGYYRIVTAGTVHVYGVVGYDVATASYYTYTYNVLDDERHSYLDYSKDNPNFTDCENGIVTFEVPIEVNEYILGVTGQTKGLGILQGTVNSFDVPEDFDGTVVIPQYHSTNNGGDGSDSAYKVTSFSEDVFKNKTEITRVILPTYVTEIPDNAFEGCTNLETVIAYGVTKIGANAFKGCTSLNSFSLDNKITELGENAFEGVEELKVMAANASVADAAINSGAKNITINISKMVDSLDKEGNIVNSYNNDKEIVITEGCESFTLISDGLSYNNLQIESHATETFISNMKFVNNKVTPLKLHSPKVTLARVAVENSQGFALMLLADNTQLNLYAAVPLSSVSKKTVLSKNVTFAEASAGVSGSALNVTGNYYIYGSVTNDKMLKISEGELVYINEDEFANMQSTATINFNANGGNVAVEDASKIVTYNQTYGTLPVPTRQYFTFLGWYTEAEGGTEITENSTVNVLGEQTLYAQWAQNVYSVVFDANGGTVTETLRTISCGEAIGELPVPQRTGYNFDGWYTEDNTQITADTISGTETTIQAIAKWTAKAYKISWNTGTGYKITVNRTSSPYANAATGALASGDTIFEGDVLSIAYSATTGYSLGNKGKTSVIVTGNVTASDIYANATANNYTYNILYRSTNGTDLGSATATYKYNTTNTISAPAKSGYNTPAAQTVAWNSTSAKTITFYYEPTYLYFAQGMADGNWYVWDGKYGITYGAYTEFQNRTANSIQIRIVWTNTMKKNSWYGYAQYFTGNIGGISTGEVQIASSSLWNSGTSSDRTATVTSNWITVPVSATQRTVSISASYRDLNGIKGSWSNTVNIPTY